MLADLPLTVYRITAFTSAATNPRFPHSGFGIQVKLLRISDFKFDPTSTLHSEHSDAGRMVYRGRVRPVARTPSAMSSSGGGHRRRRRRRRLENSFQFLVRAFSAWLFSSPTLQVVD